MSKRIGVTAFRANCLRILDEIERSGETVTVTKRGRPVVEIEPVEKRERRSIIGSMKGTVLRYDRPFDPASELDAWHANR